MCQWYQDPDIRPKQCNALFSLLFTSLKTKNAPDGFFICCLHTQPAVYRHSLPLPVVLSEISCFSSAVYSWLWALRSLGDGPAKVLGWI